MKISVIVFNRKWDCCEKTINSILQGENKKNIADITIINCSKECKTADLKKLSEKYASVKYIDTEENNDIKNELEYAIANSKGDYINITEAGVIWNDAVVKEISKVTQEDDIEAMFMQTTSELDFPYYNIVLRFLENEKKYINLYDTFKMFHIFYPAYFVLKEKFDCNNAKIESDILQIMEKMFSISENVKFIKILEEGTYEWDECTSVKDVKLKFQTKPEEVYDYLNDVIGNILENKTFENGVIPKNAQFQIATYLQYLFADSNKMVGKLSDKKLAELKSLLEKIIMKLDNSMIAMHGGFTAVQKKLLFEKKYKLDAKKMYKDGDEYIYVNNEKIVETERMYVNVQFVNLEKNSIMVEGYFKSVPVDGDFKVYAGWHGEKIECETLEKDIKEYWFDEIIADGVTFKIDLELNGKRNSEEIEFWCHYNNKWYKRKNYVFGKYAPLTSEFETSYFANNGWVLTCDMLKGVLKIDKTSKKDIKQREKAFINEIKAKDEPAVKKAILARKMYFIAKKFRRKKVWLVSDRINHGDDNGEAMFRALHDNRRKIRNKKVYFVIDKNTKEFKELRKYGKTISTLSWQHKFNHLLSEYIISAHANNPVVNVFGVYSKYYKDILCRSKFVFLQHGVTKDDQSDWLNKYNRNIHGLIVTTQAEYESMFNYNYFYDESRIWLTGMPRYDRLYHNEKKYITFMPTWRKSLTTGADPATGIWKIRDDFKASSYYQYYNSILNDERLIKAAKEHGYTICFMPHPNIAHVVNQFKKNENVIFLDSNKCYRDVFAETDLMITDYSSVAFDFAYLRKPIIYTQYDREEFFNGAHSYTEGYYNYDTDGFGEVECDYEGAIDRIIEYMENGCKLKPEYEERINNTFAYDDKNCCKRILDKLLGK